MDFLSQDIEDIIISYKKDLEHAENKKRVIEQINQIHDWIISKRRKDLQTLQNLKMPMEFDSDDESDESDDESDESDDESDESDESDEEFDEDDVEDPTEFKLYIDSDSFDISDTGCYQCKKKYYDIYFTGYVIMKKSKETIFGVFKGYDNQCLCDDGPVKQVLCKLHREHQVENEWQFLHYYVDNEKIVDKLIKILTKRLICL